MNRLYIASDLKGNLAYSIDSGNWTPNNQQTQNVMISYDKLFWFPITKQVQNILSCIQINKSEGIVKLKQYIQQQIKL